MIGLCETCVHAKPVKGTRTTFWMCLRSQTDPSFPRYPRLPVLQCRGYEAKPARMQPDATKSG